VRLTRLEPSTHRIISRTEIADNHANYVSPTGLSSPSISPNKRWAVVKKPEGDPIGATLFQLDEQFELVGRFPIPADKMFWDVMFSPNGNWALTRSRTNRTVADWLWDLKADDPTRAPTQLKGRIAGSFHTAAAFSRDTSLLAIGENAGRASVWDMKADDPSATHMTLKTGSHVVSVAISPDNKWIATGSNSGTVHLWCMDDENPTANPMVLVGDTSQVYRLQFHPQLPILVSHSNRGKIRLWNYDVESAIQGARRLAGRTLSPSERDELGLTTK
jgi:hypothetical protein